MKYAMMTILNPQDNGPYRNQDETVELAINLNLDPRRAGQSLRGSISLPHGTGKQVNCIVFTNSKDLVDQALKNGALYAGGEELVDKIIGGEIPLGDLQRALATNDIMPLIQKQLARLLGPRGLMPNPKVNTVFQTPEELLESLKEQARNITYRTESNGIIHFPVGKGSFEPDKLMENIQQICQTIQAVKPEQYGKGKKKKMGKNVKYWLRAHLSSTQGPGVRVDLKTVDPTSPFFLKDPETV
jgi:large subunit ribosomal protein L1